MKMNNKYIVVVAAIVLLILGGGYFLLIANKSTQKEEIIIAEPQEEAVLTLSPKDIDLSIDVSLDKRYVTLIIGNAKGITHLEWEFSYEADIPVSERIIGESEDRVTQSFGGEADLDGTERTFESARKELGTCSSGRCRFDTGITEISVIIKVTKTDGKVYQVETLEEI